MISKINYFIASALLVAAALVVVLENTDPVTVRFGGETLFSSGSGVALLVSLFVGLTLSGLVALAVAAKSYFRERKHAAAERSREAAESKVLLAREAEAARNWGRARSFWEQAVRKNPSDVDAAIGLARALERSGDLKGALDVLDRARLVRPDRLEILYRAAEVNIALDNHTAALDNLQLVLDRGADEYALETAAALAEKLGRWDDALAFHERAEAIGAPAPHDVLRVRFGRVVAGLPADDDAARAALAGFVADHPAHAPSLLKLAEYEERLGRPDDAAALRVKAASLTGDVETYRVVAESWLSRGQPERALGVARAARNSAVGASRVEAELLLASLYLSLGLNDDARAVLDGVRPDETTPRPAAFSWHALHGTWLERTGRVREAALYWSEVSRLLGGAKPTHGGAADAPPGHVAEPSPALSHP